MASKPQKTDVVIVGAGASGAAAAKVLCEAGVKVVALEKGPWRTKETFGGDELANINRYNLWPDPILNPRTWRETAADTARNENFCPVPQMVHAVSRARPAPTHSSPGARAATLARRCRGRAMPTRS